MASETSKNPLWAALLAKSYKVIPLEMQVYKAKQKSANGNEMFAKYICDAMKEGEVNDDLRQLYIEGVYGSDEYVKARILKRMYTVRQKVL